MKRNPDEGIMNVTTSATCAQPDTLTLESFREMLAKFPPPGPDPWSFQSLRPSFAGLEIIERPLPPPKIQVSKEAEWIFTPEDLAEMNAFLLERFGRYKEDTNLYHFSRYLSIPSSVAGDFRRIINMGAV